MLWLLIKLFKGFIIRGWSRLCGIIANIGPFALSFSFRASILASFISIGNSWLSFKSLRILFAQQTNNEYNLWILLSLNPFPQRDMLVLVLSYPYVLGFIKLYHLVYFRATCLERQTVGSCLNSAPFNSIPPTWWTWEPNVWK